MYSIHFKQLFLVYNWYLDQKTNKQNAIIKHYSTSVGQTPKNKTESSQFIFVLSFNDYHH